MTMRCARCGKYGIRWVGPLSDLHGTECPHCGGKNCQEPGEDENDPSYEEMDEAAGDTLSGDPG